MDYKEFDKSIRNVNASRTHKIKSSVGVLSAFNYYRKHKPGRDFTLTPSEFLSIIRIVNDKVANFLIENKSVNLPCGFGRLEIRRKDLDSWIDDDGNFNTNRPVDMRATLGLWYEDPEARKNKTVVRFENDHLFFLKYPLAKRRYKNYIYFHMQFCRPLKDKLKARIRAGNYDTLKDKIYR